MLIANAKKQKLSELGITLWQPRIARCLVLLSSKQHATKVLEGMISVLQLPAAHVVRIIVNKLDPIHLAAKLHKWQPQHILQLTMEFPAVRGADITCTFSPDHLAANPTDKASAYKQLLLLRGQT